MDSYTYLWDWVQVFPFGWALPCRMGANTLLPEDPLHLPRGVLCDLLISASPDLLQLLYLGPTPSQGLYRLPVPPKMPLPYIGLPGSSFLSQDSQFPGFPYYMSFVLSLNNITIGVHLLHPCWVCSSLTSLFLLIYLTPVSSVHHKAHQARTPWTLQSHISLCREGGSTAPGTLLVSLLQTPIYKLPPILPLLSPSASFSKAYGCHLSP